MRRFLHAAWPLAAVLALTFGLAVQIPRKALFFEPARRLETVPFASFVSYDAAAYGALVRKVRMSWQMRSRAAGPHVESPVDLVGLGEALPPPAELPLPRDFLVPRVDAPSAAAGPAPSLLPPSVADARRARPVSVPPDDGEDARARLRRDLLRLPDALREDPFQERFQEHTEKESMP